MKRGICKLCQKEKRLNKEHIPPKSAGNKSTRYKTDSLMDYMTSLSPLEYKPKGKTYQGGIVFYSFCKDCNNKLGIEYVREYKKWYNLGKLLTFNKADKNQCIEVQQAPIDFTKVYKHILSMFLAVDSTDCLSSNMPFIEYINNSESMHPPKEFRLFCYLNNGPSLRYLNPMVRGDISTQQYVLCSEITFPPFGYVLVINNPNYQNDLLTEITEFRNIKGPSNFKLCLNVLPTVLSIILDYRSLEEIEKSI